MIYWTVFQHADWQFIVAATEKGLCFTGSENRDEQELLEWAKKRRKGEQLARNDEKLEPYLQQFKEYLTGERKDFDFSLDVKGTAFQQQVWQALQAIPFGAVQCYSDIATAIDNPKAVRAVGTAIGANPVMIAIPCHRVIGKNRTLTGFRAGLDMKKKLLMVEGVTIP
ncbi:methylated-DNA--[protein]-cysteine S-methyltransferase [Lysinibacillus sp. KU-BSD001]|uniref:methylated-DNA--[protein]-cysteine S-methyltransferase n=1 Tax=Lysinibacillus sp. KU-BSD001 TaxID=3141328 RepID=UPI0036F14A1D